MYQQLWRPDWGGYNPTIHPISKKFKFVLIIVILMHKPFFSAVLLLSPDEKELSLIWKSNNIYLKGSYWILMFSLWAPFIWLSRKSEAVWQSEESNSATRAYRPHLLLEFYKSSLFLHFLFLLFFQSQKPPGRTFVVFFFFPSSCFLDFFSNCWTAAITAMNYSFSSLLAVDAWNDSSACLHW